MFEILRSRNGWIYLVIAVLIASTIVTATLAAVLTQVMFPNGFLIDLPGEEERPQVQAPLPDDTAEATSPGFGWRTSVSCSISFGNVEEAGGRGDARP